MRVVGRGRNADEGSVLNDVAAASGVSRATASFVLRDSPNQSISAATRERVRQAARDLGYVPHAIARALREGSSRIVVLSLDAELAAHDHALFVRYERDTEVPRPVLEAIAPRAVLRFGEPYLTGRELEDSGGGWRDGLAAYVAAQVGYLAGRGHTRIAYALPDRETPLRAVRLRLAARAAEMLGLSPVAAFSTPSFRTGAADSLAEIRAATRRQPPSRPSTTTWRCASWRRCATSASTPATCPPPPAG